MATRNTSITEQLRMDIDSCAESIVRVRAIGKAIASNTDQLRELLSELDERIVEIHSKLPRRKEVTVELGRIRMRIQRIQELRNMQELGSFEIQIGRAMETAWRELP